MFNFSVSKPDCGNGGMNQNTFGGGNGGGGGFRGGRRAQSMGPRYGGGDQQHQLVDRSSRQTKKKNEAIDPNKLDMEMDAYMESHPGNSMC